MKGIEATTTTASPRPVQLAAGEELARLLLLLQAQMPKQTTIAVWDFAPDKPMRFETEDEIIFAISPQAWREVVGLCVIKIAHPATVGSSFLGVPVVELNRDSASARRVHETMRQAFEQWRDERRPGRHG